MRARSGRRASTQLGIRIRSRELLPYSGETSLPFTFTEARGSAHPPLGAGESDLAGMRPRRGALLVLTRRAVPQTHTFAKK